MKSIDRLDKLIGIVVISIILIAILILGIRMWRQKKNVPVAGEAPATIETTPQPPAILDYGKLDKDAQLKALMQERKEAYGITKGLDMIAKPEESIKIGEATVSMQEILDEIKLGQGKIVEKEIDRAPSPSGATGASVVKEIDRAPSPSGPAGASVAKEINRAPSPSGSAGASVAKEIDRAPSPSGPADASVAKEINRAPSPSGSAGASVAKEDVYGIYIVQPGDNIWNIHFQFLKGYFDHKGISLSPLADEPDRRGLSSGVAKLLKFSENMVYVYNLRERKLDVDLNLIHPLSKIVVFRMKQVFALLDGIDYNRVGRIQFDGETLWIPANQ